MPSQNQSMIELPDLVYDDEKFIQVGKTILKQVRQIKREKFPTLFQRLFKSKARRRNPHVSDQGERIPITAETLEDFKLAILFRFDDCLHTSVFLDTYEPYTIPNLIDRVVRNVNIVGWPETESEEATVASEEDCMSM